MAKKPRRKCKAEGCGAWFHAAYSNVWWCSPEHGAEYALQLRSNEKQKAEDERQAKRRQAVKPLSHFTRLAQQAFNEYIRYRDRDLPCISCGRFHSGQYHAGHYRTTGSNPELRFNEDNCHRQCAPCNNHLSGNLTAYRPALITKIGQVRFDALMGPHELPKWTREDYMMIRDTYRAKLKELKQQAAA